MIKSVRIHHTSDGGTLDIGASDKSVIEFGGMKFSLESLSALRAHAESGDVIKVETVGPMVSFSRHACPEPEQKPDPKPARKRASAEE